MKNTCLKERIKSFIPLYQNMESLKNYQTNSYFTFKNMLAFNAAQ